MSNELHRAKEWKKKEKITKLYCNFARNLYICLRECVQKLLAYRHWINIICFRTEVHVVLAMDLFSSCILFLFFFFVTNWLVLLLSSYSLQCKSNDMCEFECIAVETRWSIQCLQHLNRSFDVANSTQVGIYRRIYVSPIRILSFFFYFLLIFHFIHTRNSSSYSPWSLLNNKLKRIWFVSSRRAVSSDSVKFRVHGNVYIHNIKIKKSKQKINGKQVK